jgi:hypothetical protein
LVLVLGGDSERRRSIKLVKIDTDTKEQLGDIFTKGLAQPAFEYLRSKMIGW